MADDSAASRVAPALVKGMRDLTADTLLARHRMLETVRAVYERFGFQPFETPVVEFRDTLLGSGAGDNTKRIFSWRHAEDDTELGLRFDLTVPLARFVAMHPNAPRPFKRYQAGSVFRVDKPGAGRFREFMQFDIDTIGTDSLLADAEIVAAITTALEALGLGASGGFTLYWNHRQVLNAALAAAGVSETLTVPVIRVLDKFDKIGLDGVCAELGAGRMDSESGARIPGIGIENAGIDKVAAFLALGATEPDGLEPLLGTAPGGAQALAACREFLGHLQGFGLPAGRVRMDPRLARGMDYYTGPIFEVRLDAAPEFGSVAGGGRYDNLVARFASESLPGTGASIGVDRLLAALVHLGRSEARKSATDVLVTVMDKSLLPQCLAITQELRAAGLRAEIYLQPTAKLKKQMAYADAWGIPAAVLLGSNEAEKNEVTVKDLRAGAAAMAAPKERSEYLGVRAGQVTLPRAQLIAHLRQILGQHPPTQP